MACTQIKDTGANRIFTDPEAIELSTRSEHDSKEKKKSSKTKNLILHVKWKLAFIHWLYSILNKIIISYRPIDTSVGKMKRSNHKMYYTVLPQPVSDESHLDCVTILTDYDQ